MKTPSAHHRLPTAALAACLLMAAASPMPAQADFDRDVKPVLVEHCFKCHGPAKQKGGLRFDVGASALRAGDSGEPAIVAGKADQSELMRRVVSKDETVQMPPEGPRLSAEKVDVLRKWINAGAKRPADAPGAAIRTAMVVTDDDRKHWAFAPLRAVEPPPISATGWARTPIDAFILARLDAHQLAPSKPVDPRRLIRRVYFDVIGLPPEPAEVDAFVKAWPGETRFSGTPSAYEKLIDRLLASPHYGERWGRHWLDAARYADSDGQEGDQDRPTAYHYRDFVIRALNDDLPIDTFLRWQLAGDEIDPDNPLALAATGFLTAGPHTVLDVPMMEEKIRNRYNELDDTLSTIGSAMLGLTIGCARCHDHKFDAIPARDYYRMLSAVHTGGRAEVPLATRSQVADEQRLRGEWDRSLKAAEAKLKTWLDAQKAPLRAKLRDRKIDALMIDADDKKTLREQPASDAGKRLAKQHEKALAISDDDWRKAMTDEQRKAWADMAGEIGKLRDRQPAPLPTALAYRDGSDTPATTWLFERGDFFDRDEPVELGFLTVLTRGKSPEEYRTQAIAQRPLENSTYQRKAMAQWITDLDHGAGALAARVMVNRIWQHHFGDGLSRTPSDFGTQGDRPTHPQLLEWLAHDFVKGGWKLKRLHRMILTSAVYMQGSADPRDSLKAAIDPENRWLWRMTPRRLEAEILRDAILASSGTLSRKTYGPAVKPPIAPEAIVARNLKDGYPADAKDTEATRRRSVYLFHKRVVPHPLLQAFDAPDAAQSCGRRNRTTVAPQALVLLNDPFVRSRAGDFADRLMREAGDEPAAWVERAFQLALGRSPREVEAKAALAFIASQLDSRKARDKTLPIAENQRRALADFCQAMFGLNEFAYVD